MPTARRRRKPIQLALSARGHRGGHRHNGGRPCKRPSDLKGHRPRPPLAARFPVHVTLKLLPNTPNLRRRACFIAVNRAFRAGNDRFGFRLVHFSVQGNHIHLICEAKDADALTRGMQGLAIRIARRLNKQTGRKGRLFSERYHARILRSPTEVRRVLAYVLNNARRHAGPHIALPRDWIDPLSSAPWFNGWKFRPMSWRPSAPPVVPATTWLLATGWRRAGQGLIAPDEVPGPP